MSKSEKKTYRRLPTQTDPKVCLRIPMLIHNEIVNWAEKNARTKSEEIIARLLVTLQNNDTFMSHDQLMRLIYSKKLAYKPKNNKD